MDDGQPPCMLADDVMARKVEKSTISYAALKLGQVSSDQIERAFSSDGCGAVLIRLEGKASTVPNLLRASVAAPHTFSGNG